MILRAAALCLLTCASPSLAQEGPATNGTGATLRVLDRVTGTLEDVHLASGSTAQAGRLIIELSECRYPTGNPSGDAFAFLRIADEISSDEVFSGWMVASAPALNALDHARYDVWVIRCRTS